ncbi:hypothetical protein H4219_002973 [Mycoemilia scoparia]|uniref:UspA domain-containing protein n=1 Tax=Mycoemilia scoparia TaxID=417184 RepID=A0A9W8DNH0_9FUNG|nr:hypothetical protein H4219_002973 [Mycoemilia scoparia]
MKGIPLSLRRKIVIAFDAERLVPGSLSPAEEERAEHEFLNSAKMLAWINSNILRPEKDHVFIVSVVNNTKVFDPSVISEMLYSMTNENQATIDKHKKLEDVLERLGEKLANASISFTIETLTGSETEKLVECCSQHKAELLICQAAQSSQMNKLLGWSWSDKIAQQSPCPCMLIKAEDLSDSLLALLRDQEEHSDRSNTPSPPTQTTDSSAPPQPGPLGN